MTRRLGSGGLSVLACLVAACSATDGSGGPRADSAARSPSGSSEPPAPPPFQPACAELPVDRPSDLVVRREVHDPERPENLVRHTVFDASRSCPPDDMPGHLLATYRPHVCVPVGSAELDRLYAELRRLGFASIRARPVEPAPHSVGSAVTLEFSDASCRASNVHNVVELHPDDEDAFRAVDAAVTAVIRRALGAD